ncbi:uncharacterized protein L969DRAFT_43819 [Mixia osmundae IAM 14324]|uniref:Ribosomal protein/NADH dehydrogenase domain-containing protein n=1 Tax=Mixia osmundae (strain CBS 9802 / IAM 14324 / JCM 22182 / KY 12970) TaxID=764103 RepID=G7DTB7_MIXOS|nr:uncharacterized protein L969DRAFT_43819 [Mixia osmundae IAM 14324]KEI42898.1 hypothetical protein L969DRAFT_43819 [Mixia osmundae IAM 14324]GAA93764.1 hypothetical protein E5Q_00410 [Mixia osmundae IAM 14324]
MTQETLATLSLEQADAMRLSRKKVLAAQRLVSLRSGPGARSLPRNVRSISLVFKGKDKHWGSRQFCKELLPQLIYTNQSITFDVHKPRAGNPKPILTLKFADGTERQRSTYGRQAEEILSDLLTIARDPKTTQLAPEIVQKRILRRARSPKPVKATPDPVEEASESAPKPKSAQQVLKEDTTGSESSPSAGVEPPDRLGL